MKTLRSLLIIYMILLVITCNGCGSYPIHDSFQSHRVLNQVQAKNNQRFNLENIQAKIAQVQLGDFGEFMVELHQAEQYLTKAQTIYELLKTSTTNNHTKNYFIEAYSAANKALVHRNNAEVAFEQLLSSITSKIADNSRRLNYMESLHVKQRTVIPITNIYFNFGSYRFKSTEIDKIKQLINFLRQHPVFALKLVSYADTVGSKNYNIRLAKRRNQAVLKELKAQGLPINTIVTIAVGEVNGPDETQNADNRRVEIKPYVHGNYRYPRS